MDALTALAVAAALHAGFQLTVTSVVYPALARVPAERWSTAHEAHGRSIVPVVGITYLGLAGTGLWALIVAPGNPWVWLSVAGALVAGVTTAAVAAPTHGALGRGRDDALLGRLLVADRVRSLGAVVALAGALAALLV
ncbi:hypothetical protein [Ornithinimicrobium sediminis]|uniref:hypothetical protein n=1 Tax=Ornithinimicrobium sediminis TaxID=2904603 RepID=UPI001E624DB4|nr:hypothetical protein [Ornithinimicrobium sediminis]MCE0487080.1 hypothetical protein [Ornithinimicrobium sediminis]